MRRETRGREIASVVTPRCGSPAPPPQLNQGHPRRGAVGTHLNQLDSTAILPTSASVWGGRSAHRGDVMRHRNQHLTGHEREGGRPGHRGLWNSRSVRWLCDALSRRQFQQYGRYLADHIPGARLLEVEGTDHFPWFDEPDKILTGIEEFLTGSHAAPLQSHRALRTVLFTDVVASTQHAAAAGDERWRAVLHRFGEITAELTERFGGTVVKSTGDGYLATFDGPT
jgi:hypothetical protein